MVGRNERAEIHPKERAAEAEPVLQIEVSRAHARLQDVDLSVTPGHGGHRGHHGLGPGVVVRAFFGAEAYD